MAITNRSINEKPTVTNHSINSKIRSGSYSREEVPGMTRAATHIWS